jgi:hypothetical protein
LAGGCADYWVRAIFSLTISLISSDGVFWMALDVVRASAYSN